MQNSNFASALDELAKKNLRREKTALKLQTLRKKLEVKKPKNFLPERAAKAQLVNLRIANEFRKKMDAVPQKTNKNE
ncbi:MAG: hypothetical protein WCV72_00605 [Patescibacteria group bacterium]